MAEISDDLIQANVDDLIAKIKGQLKDDSVVYTLTMEELYDQQKVVSTPLVGVAFKEITPAADSVPERLMINVRLIIWVVTGRKHFVLRNGADKATGTMLLQSIAKQLARERAASGRPWRFISQYPIDFGDDLGLGFSQEWETLAVLQ